MMASRPMVDPDAEGEVNPDLYPEPKEATHKIRGKNDLIEHLFGSVDQEMISVKTFYFFFYSAFGSLFPLMGVYFKQMGMNAAQCGLLIGIRPLIEFFSSPFWGSLADRYQKGRIILLASISCWIIFTLPIGFIQPPATSCIIYKNNTSYLKIGEADKLVSKRSANYFHSEKYGSGKSAPVDRNYDSINDMKEMNQSPSQLKFSNAKDPEAGLNKKFPSSKIIKTDDLIRMHSSVSDNLESKKIGIVINRRNHPFLKSYIDSTIPATKISRLTIDEPNEKIRRSRHTFDKQEKLSRKAENDEILLSNLMFKSHDTVQSRKQRHFRLTPDFEGQSPLSVKFASNYNEKQHKNWVKPFFSNIVYKLGDIQKSFFLLLLMVIVGEFLAAPAITLADSAVLTLLGEDSDRYGHQRMFGSLGWGLAMFFVGIALDHSTSFPNHPCGPEKKEKNYTICFAIFSVLMGAALITATQISFKYDPVAITEPQETVVNYSTASISKEDELQYQLSQQLNLPELQEAPTMSRPNIEPIKENKTKIFAQTLREIPEWITVLKQFNNIKCASFLFVAWFMGFGIGLIFTFLFWHLQDYGGTPTLFGVASVINHISEIFAYFFSFKLINQFGHVKVLCLGLGGNVLRFLYISWLKNPWWVLPFEFIQGITHASVWAACCSYIAHNTPYHLRSNAQGVLQGLHHGIGRGCGAVIGGICVAGYGTTATFRFYGLLCLVVLGAFIFINFYRKDLGFISELPQTEDPHQLAEATQLAPHGVPSNAIPRALSSNRLHDMNNQGYMNDMSSNSPFLNVTNNGNQVDNPHNPFMRNFDAAENQHEETQENWIKSNFKVYDEIMESEFGSKTISPPSTYTHIQQPCKNPFHEHSYEW